MSFSGVVHENPKISSEDELVEVQDNVPKPVEVVKVRQRPKRASGDINKRLSLPADLHLPESFIAKTNIIDAPLTRSSRRQSLSEIGFGRIESYFKLNKLGQVRLKFETDLIIHWSFSLKNNNKINIFFWIIISNKYISFNKLDMNW